MSKTSENQTAVGGAKSYVHKPKDYALADLPYTFQSLDDYEFIEMEDDPNE